MNNKTTKEWEIERANNLGLCILWTAFQWPGHCQYRHWILSLISFVVSPDLCTLFVIWLDSFRQPPPPCENKESYLSYFVSKWGEKQFMSQCNETCNTGLWTTTMAYLLYEHPFGHLRSPGDGSKHSSWIMVISGSGKYLTLSVSSIVADRHWKKNVLKQFPPKFHSYS
jgi:hypothetical protein